MTAFFERMVCCGQQPRKCHASDAMEILSSWHADGIMVVILVVQPRLVPKRGSNHEIVNPLTFSQVSHPIAIYPQMFKIVQSQIMLGSLGMGGGVQEVWRERLSEFQKCVMTSQAHSSSLPRSPGV